MIKPHLRYKNQTRRERTLTIHLIALEKAVKGTVLLIVAFKMLTLFNRDVHGWAEDFVTRHGIDLANRYVQTTLQRLSGVGNTQIVELSVGATVYALLLFVEGIGLWLQKRWAEYLTTALTALFIPVEIYELYEKFTWVRVGILAINIFIVWYLTTRLRDEKTENIEESDADADRPQIKICGLTNIEDARLAADLGADQLGFNFYQKSPRYISPGDARAIIDRLPERVLKVGVFVNESVENILAIVRSARLDAVQLHGDEDAAFVTELRRDRSIMIIRAVRVKPKMTAAEATHPEVDAILLDSYSTTERGGTGETFDWTFASEVKAIFPEIYLAGGLSPENVADAISAIRPYAVDACSRLESEPGKKDHEKVAAFIKAVKEAI